MHPLKPDRLHQLHDPLETRAHVRRQGVQLCLGLGTDKAERPLHESIYHFCNRIDKQAGEFALLVRTGGHEDRRQDPRHPR